MDFQQQKKEGKSYDAMLLVQNMSPERVDNNEGPLLKKAGIHVDVIEIVFPKLYFKMD